MKNKIKQPNTQPNPKQNRSQNSMLISEDQGRNSSLDSGSQVVCGYEVFILLKMKQNKTKTNKTTMTKTKKKLLGVSILLLIISWCDDDYSRTVQRGSRKLGTIPGCPWGKKMVTILITHNETTTDTISNMWSPTMCARHMVYPIFTIIYETGSILKSIIQNIKENKRTCCYSLISSTNTYLECNI